LGHLHSGRDPPFLTAELNYMAQLDSISDPEFASEDLAVRERTVADGEPAQNCFAGGQGRLGSTAFEMDPVVTGPPPQGEETGMDRFDALEIVVVDPFGKSLIFDFFCSRRGDDGQPGLGVADR